MTDVGWHHRLSGHEFEQTLGNRDRDAWHALVCILAWRIPLDRGAWWVTVHGISRS